jgi:hypothetical protein
MLVRKQDYKVSHFVIEFLHSILRYIELGLFFVREINFIIYIKLSRINVSLESSAALIFVFDKI